MATADSVKAKVQVLIDSANETTGQNDTDLTAAVNHLKEGYGQGGSAQSGTAVWNSILANGTRTNFDYAFYNTRFTKETLTLTHDIRPTSAQSMFQNSAVNASQMFSMTEVEARSGKVFDFSNCTKFSATFNSSCFNELNVIDISNATGTSSTYQMFYNGSSSAKLKRINRLIFSENTVIDWGMFGYCIDLEYVGFEGTIASDGLNLKDSTKLSKESIEKLINALSTTTSGLTVTLSQAAVYKAFETASGANDGSTSEEWLALIGTRSNWTISLA